MSKNTPSYVFALAIVIAAFLLGNAYVSRSKTKGNISVTGLGSKNFTSDLIVWGGSFSAESKDLKSAFSKLKNDKKIIVNYFKSKGVNPNNIVFNAVSTSKEEREKYSSTGKYIGMEFLGYRLTQKLSIESKEVSKITKLSREVTELLNKGINFYSFPPRYYYTKLADLKIEMISKATEDAHLRAEKIAQNSGGILGALRSAKMGIFQITGQNSNEDYSWGGAFNTSSIKKTASITMKLTYRVK
jgi:uncharacterized protein